MKLVTELSNANNPRVFFSDEDFSYFKYQFEKTIRDINQRYNESIRIRGTCTFAKEYYGYYGGKPMGSLGVYGLLGDYVDDDKVINSGGLCWPEFMANTHNGCRVLESRYYRGPIFPFPTIECATYCKQKIEAMLIDMGFTRYKVQVEKVYFSWKHFKGGVLFKHTEVREYDKEPSYIVFAHVAW